MKDFKKVITYFIPFFKKDKKIVLSIFFMYGISIVIGGIITPIIYKKIIDIISSSNTEVLLTTFLVLICITVVGFIFHRIGDYLLVKFQSKNIRDIHNKSFEKLTQHSYNFFVNSFSGSLVAKAKRFVKSFETIFDSILFSFYLTSLYLIGMFIVLMGENFFLGISFLVWVVIFMLVTFRMNRMKIPLNLKSSEQDSKVSGYLSDVITNISNVKIFSSYFSEKKGFANVVNKDYLARKKQWFFDNRIWIVTGGLLLLFELIGMGISLYLWSRGIISTGTVVLVQIYIASLGRFLWNLGRSIIRFTTSVSEAVEFVVILEQEIDIKDNLEYEELAIGKGEINFKDVSFTYPNGDHVFDGFNLVIPSGQSVGVVGKSGSGKTTLTKLLLRFYDVNQGALTIDGQDISRLRQADLRSKIAYIPQETILFHRSIYENISYGISDISRGDVIKASLNSYVDEFVQNLEKKYDTEVGERGVKLSGGQRQRIGIARAMLRHSAPILVLDEATSSLDSMSEQYIQKSFEKLSKNRTTIVIAHRLSTIQKMDRIIVMDHGSIIEDGSHDHLLAKKGHYAKLWNSQVGGFIPDEV